MGAVGTAGNPTRSLVIVWFRDDLRLTDNPALREAAVTGQPLLCMFVFDEVSEGLRPPSNLVNWQWVAGCGADAAPYFRIFNPVLQGEKFDPDGEYVRRWVPELAGLPAAVVHQPWAASAAELRAARVHPGENYPERIVEHQYARQRALDALKRTTPRT